MSQQCPECESFLDDSVAFCGQCGASVERRRKPFSARIQVSHVLLFLCLLGVLVVVAIRLQTDREPAAIAPVEVVPALAAGDSEPDVLVGPEVVRKRVRSESVEDRDEPLPLTSRKVRVLTHNATTRLELYDSDQDLLGSRPGILIGSDGLLLCRFRSLLGATGGLCHVRGPRTLKVAGAVHVDPVRDLALLQLSEVDGDIRIDEPLPGLLSLTESESRSSLDEGFAIFLSGEESAWQFGVISQENYYGLDQVSRLRVSGEEPFVKELFVAVDPLASLIGLCYREERGRGSYEQESSILIDSVESVAGFFDSESLRTLEELSAEHFDDTFAAFFYRGKKAWTKENFEVASGFLFDALRQGAVEQVEEEKLEEASGLLEKTVKELIVRWRDADQWERLAGLLERALEFFPDEADFWGYLARSFLELERYEDSILPALRFRELRPGRDADLVLRTGFLRLALVLYRETDLYGASRVLLEGLDYLPGSGLLHLELGKIYQKWDSLEDAARVFQIAKGLDVSLAREVDLYLEKIDDELKRREAVIIPIREGARSIRAPVVVNGGSRFEFLVDTGASLTAISQDMARELGYRIGPQLRWIRVRTANGVVEAPIVVLESLSIQGFTVENVEAIALPRHGSKAGLLGLNFLNHFKYTVDANRGELRLQPR